MGSLIGLVATDLDTWTGLAVSNGLAMPVLAPAEGVAVESVWALQLQLFPTADPGEPESPGYGGTEPPPWGHL